MQGNFPETALKLALLRYARHEYKTTVDTKVQLEEVQHLFHIFLFIRVQQFWLLKLSKGKRQLLLFYS